jgi:hypothetical protein
MIVVSLGMSVASAGTWTLTERLVSEVRPPLSGWKETVSESVWLVDWPQGSPTLTATLCKVTAEPVMGAQSVFPKVDVARRRPVSFDGATFAMGPTLEVMGEDDEDDDGNPGISVEIRHPRIGGGSAFVRQQAKMQWSGRAQPDGRISGSMVYEPEQELLGATTWWLKVGTNIRAKVGSTFELVPADGSAGCGTEAP